MTLFGEGGGQAIVAAPRDQMLIRLGDGVELRPLGTAGGATLLGVGVDELRAAWERD